jgi:hypothetical protein
MKTALQIISLISTGLAVGSILAGKIDIAILFLVWGFYLKYLSDKNK